MSKEKQTTIKLDSQTAKDVLEVLTEAQKGYGTEFAPERIVRIRQVIESLNS